MFCCSSQTSDIEYIMLKPRGQKMFDYLQWIHEINSHTAPTKYMKQYLFQYILNSAKISLEYPKYRSLLSEFRESISVFFWPQWMRPSGLLDFDTEGPENHKYLPQFQPQYPHHYQF